MEYREAENLRVASMPLLRGRTGPLADLSAPLDVATLRYLGAHFLHPGPPPPRTPSPPQSASPESLRQALEAFAEGLAQMPEGPTADAAAPGRCVDDVQQLLEEAHGSTLGTRSWKLSGAGDVSDHCLDLTIPSLEPSFCRVKSEATGKVVNVALSPGCGTLADVRLRLPLDIPYAFVVDDEAITYFEERYVELADLDGASVSARPLTSL